MAKTRDYMDYLDDNIEIAPANSQEEYAAADTIAQVLQDHELETSIEEFDAHPLGKLVKPILTCVLLILFVIALLTEGAPHVIMLLLMAAIVAVPLVEHFMGVKLFENFGPASRSQNVVAVHRATGDKVVKGARPIVIVAHYDTPHESLLYKQPLARYQSTLRAVTVPCYIAIAVSVFFQILLFLPPVLRTVAWVVGLIALLPVLAISVMDVISHFANSTLGSNDNKSGVAALLAIANKVRPMSDRVSDDFEETDHKPARRRSADDSVEPAAPKYVEIVEEVKGVRHGADVLNALGILPVSCEVVYKEPRVQVVEQMDTDVITAGDEDEAKKSSESNGAAAAAVAVAGAVAAVAAADEEKPLDEEAEPAEKSLDEDVPSIDEEAQDSHEDDYDENAGDEDLYDDEADYDDEEDFDEEVDYDEDEEWEDSSIATVGAWLKDRFSGIREFFSKDKGSDIEIDKGEDRRDANAESDEYDEWIDDTYDEDADAEYEEAEFVEEFDDQDHEVVDYDDEDTEDELDDEYEYEEELEYEDELDEELDEDETYEVIDDLGEDMLEEELLEEDEAEVEGEAEAEVEDEVPAYEGYDENILEEEAYEDALLANEDFDDDVYEEELLEEDEELIEDEVTEDEYVEEEYVDEDVYEEDESEEVYEVEDEVDEYVDFEYDDDEEAYEDEEVYEDEEAYEDEEVYEDEYEEVYEEQDQPSGIGARIARFFSRIRGNGEPADDAYGAEDLFDQAYDGEEEEEVYEQYESYEEDDKYEEYEEYEDADDETYEEEEPPEQIEDDDEYEYVEEYVDEDLDEDGEVYEYVEDEEAFEEVEQDEDGFVDADLEFDDEVEYQSEPVRRAEELLDPNRLHFDREEDPNIPRDTTGLDMISDSYDLYSGEVNRAASREKPEPLEDSSWGVSSYQPARPAMNIARRAALFDLPDPSFASIDPFEDDEYEDYDDEYDEGEEIVSDELDYDEPEAYEPEPAPEPDAPDTFEDEEEAYYEDEVEEPTNRAQDNNSFWGSNRNTNWKGGATVRSDLRDDDMDDPLIIDADDLQDAILELGDDFLVAHDIWFVATGASEANHAGIRAFIDEHRRDIRGAFLINLDSIGAGELSLLTREGLQSPRRADRRLVRMLDDIARDLHIGLKTTTYNFDERESATSMRSRVRSVTIAGLDENGLPAYSHTTDDVPENVDPKQVSDVVRIVTELIRRS